MILPILESTASINHPACLQTPFEKTEASLALFSNILQSALPDVQRRIFYWHLLISSKNFLLAKHPKIVGHAWIYLTHHPNRKLFVAIQPAHEASFPHSLYLPHQRLSLADGGGRFAQADRKEWACRSDRSFFCRNPRFSRGRGLRCKQPARSLGKGV